jgi:hypothetical protein
VIRPLRKRLAASTVGILPRREGSICMVLSLER